MFVEMDSSWLQHLAYTTAPYATSEASTNVCKVRVSIGLPFSSRHLGMRTFKSLSLSNHVRAELVSGSFNSLSQSIPAVHISWSSSLALMANGA